MHVLKSCALALFVGGLLGCLMAHPMRDIELPSTGRQVADLDAACSELRTARVRPIRCDGDDRSLHGIGRRVIAMDPL